MFSRVEGNISDKGRVLMMLTFASNIHPCYACGSESEIIKSPFSIVFDDGCGRHSHNLEKTFFGEARYKYTGNKQKVRSGNLRRGALSDTTVAPRGRKGLDSDIDGVGNRR